VLVKWNRQPPDRVEALNLALAGLVVVAQQPSTALKASVTIHRSPAKKVPLKSRLSPDLSECLLYLNIRKPLFQDPRSGV